MNDKRPSIEVIAPTVEEAIQQGLRDLSIPSSNVDVEILDEGSRGIFGIGARQARVRLTVKVVEEAVVPSSPAVETQVAWTEEQSASETEISLPSESDQNTIEVVQSVVEKLLHEMQIKAEVHTTVSQTTTERGSHPIHVDIRGKDLTILIGPQAEVLNALQYIATQIINKQLGQSIPIVIDVEGYRTRRENQIRHLARKMAEQAVKTGRRQVLEPMPANERRIVHLELRDNPNVTTESIGDEPRRKVTIIPR